MPIILLIQSPAPEAQKIESLIQAIEALQGRAVFVRNGTEHDGKAAGSHLRLKWRKAGNRVRSAPDFIRTCASASSTTGEAYTIRFKDGRTVSSADFLWSELKRLESTAK